MKRLSILLLLSAMLIGGCSGKEPGPSGEMKYAYTTEGGGGGSGTLSDAESPSVIYNLGGSGGTGSVAGQDSVVKMHVEWSGGSEDIELEPEL